MRKPRTNADETLTCQLLTPRFQCQYRGMDIDNTEQGVPMELADRLLVERFMPNNDELRKLMKNHQHYEGAIDDLARRSWLSDHDRGELRVLKKRKLRGRDRIEQILRGYRVRTAQG
jgi:SOS response regulatory protein OraA/RecX